MGGAGQGPSAARHYRRISGLASRGSAGPGGSDPEAIARGEDPAEERRAQRREVTFGELAEAYLERHSRLHKKPRSIADDEYYLKRYLPAGWRGGGCRISAGRTLSG